MRDNNRDFVRWAERHDDEQGRRYWAISKVVTIVLVLLAILAAAGFVFWRIWLSNPRLLEDVFG